MAKKLLKLSTLLGVVLVIFLLAGCPVTQPKLTLEVSTEGQGDVVLSSEGPYVKDTSVTLTAVPDDGWKFIEWSGDLSGSDNPETLVMDEDKSVTAHFDEKAPKPTITFVSVPDDVCGTHEFDVVVEVSDASTVTFLLQKDEETPIEPIDVVKSGDTYTITFEAPDLTENKNYELKVFAENEDESNSNKTGVYILQTDEMLPQISLMEFYEIPECNATSTVIEFGVCDETAIDVNSLRFDVNEGEVEYELGDIGEYCLTNGQATWTFEDVDCKELEITMFISDKCGNEDSRTLTLDIDNVKPEIEYVTDEGACSEEVQYVEWKVTENCLESFDATTCCEAVSVEFGEWVEDDSGDRIVTTIPATMTFNNIEDCTEFEFDVTAIDECGNEAEQDKFIVDKDLRDPRIRVYGFLNEELFTPHLSTLSSILLGAYDLSFNDTDATPININDLPALSEVDGVVEEGDLLGPECDAGKAYFVWIAEDDCIDETMIEYDNVCRTGEKVESFTAIPGVVVGYQRIDFDCVTDCEEIEGDLTVWDECRNDATGEATIVIDNLAPTVDWDVEDVACDDTETTITWDATDGSGNVHVFLEVSDGTPTTGYSTDAIGEVTWEFGDIDCEDLTATITVFDDCDDCWGTCNEQSAPCGGNYFEESKTVKVDNMEPEIEDLGSDLINKTESCNYTDALFTFAATENCIKDAYVEYEIIGEDASETGTFGFADGLTETLVATDPRDYTTFEGTMTLRPYDGATITAVAYVKDECHTANVTLIDGLSFDNVAPDLTYHTDPTDLECIKHGEDIFLHAEVFDTNLDDYDIDITWESTATYDSSDYTLVEVPTYSATHVTYDATLTVDATDIEDTFTVTMVATDFCGNTTTETFDFTVDSIPPTFEGDNTYEFNAFTNRLWFWLAEDIYPVGDVKLTIYFWSDGATPTPFVPVDGNPPVIGGWKKIVEGTSDSFTDKTQAMYYNQDLEGNWMKDILIANLEHEVFNYDLQDGVYYAFVLEEVKDHCGNEAMLYGYKQAISYSPGF